MVPNPLHVDCCQLITGDNNPLAVSAAILVGVDETLWVCLPKGIVFLYEGSPGNAFVLSQVVGWMAVHGDGNWKFIREKMAREAFK